MSDDSEILANAKRFASMFGGFMKACERLGQIESLEREAAAVQARLETVKQHEQDLTEQHAKKLETERAKLEAETTRERQNLENAKDEAERLAKRITYEATRQAKELTDAAEREVNEARAALMVLQSQIEGARTALGDMQNAVNQRKQQLTDLQEEIRLTNIKHASAERQLESLRSSLR